MLLNAYIVLSTWESSCRHGPASGLQLLGDVVRIDFIVNWFIKCLGTTVIRTREIHGRSINNFAHYGNDNWTLKKVFYFLGAFF